jgi:hypothetical protein
MLPMGSFRLEIVEETRKFVDAFQLFDSLQNLQFELKAFPMKGGCMSG